VSESSIHRWRFTLKVVGRCGVGTVKVWGEGRFPGEESCLSLVWAVLDLLITHETNGIRSNQLDRQRVGARGAARSRRPRAVRPATLSRRSPRRRSAARPRGH